MPTTIYTMLARGYSRCVPCHLAGEAEVDLEGRTLLFLHVPASEKTIRT